MIRIFWKTAKFTEQNIVGLLNNLNTLHDISMKLFQCFINHLNHHYGIN